MLGQNITLRGSYMDRLMTSYGHIMHIDAHRPFLSEHIHGIIQRLKPEYLVYELITSSLKDHIKCLKAQNAVIHQKECPPCI